MMPRKRKINITSLDADGCYFHLATLLAPCDLFIDRNFDLDSRNIDWHAYYQSLPKQEQSQAAYFFNGKELYYRNHETTQIQLVELDNSQLEELKTLIQFDSIPQSENVHYYKDAPLSLTSMTEILRIVGRDKNPHKILNTSKNRFIEQNEAFIKERVQAIANGGYDEAQIMVFSKRQSKAIDDHNANLKGRKVGSFYPTLEQLNQEIQSRLQAQGCTAPCTVNRYLLSDTYGKKSHGENFTNVINHNSHYCFDDWFDDESKLTILYAQIHKIASENIHAEIVFDVFDDRYSGDKDILTRLFQFFDNNKELVPPNLTINFHGYAGMGIEVIGSVKGNSYENHDLNYENNIQKMVGLFYKKGNMKGDILQQFADHPEQLSHFKESRDLSPPMPSQSILEWNSTSAYFAHTLTYMNVFFGFIQDLIWPLIATTAMTLVLPPLMPVATAASFFYAGYKTYQREKREPDYNSCLYRSQQS